ncbi:Phosphatidylinositol 5-phosphate 4-kinase type-2 alpha, partial [Trichinella pseudospiralis]
LNNMMKVVKFKSTFFIGNKFSENPTSKCCHTSTMMKSKKKLKHKPRRPIIPKWKLFRSSDPFLSVFMWGINHTITESSHIPPTRLLMPDDFKAFSKIRIDNHFFNKESMPSHFKVKEYCPNVFRSIREKFAIDDDDYLVSFLFLSYQ